MIGRQFWRNTRGNMAVLFAMGFAVSAMVAALGIDVGSLYYERRIMQNTVDLAALSAATDPNKAQALAQAAFVDAGLLDANATAGLSVVTGHYDANPLLTPDQRFTANKTPINAVFVHFQRTGSLYFARGWAPAPLLGAQAVATVTPMVSFSIGSRLASLNGGIANTVLNSLLGTTVGLSVMDYSALLNTKVDAFAFLDALATQLNLTAGTYDDLLALDADHGQIAGALVKLLGGTEKSVMQKLAASAGRNGKVTIGKLFGLGDLGHLKLGSATGQGLSAAISALDLLSASAGLSDGNHQVSLSATAQVNGLVTMDASLAVGEPPQGGSWFAVGTTGTVVRTAQTRLRIITSLLGSGALLGVPINLPLYLDLAHSEAVVGAATCPATGAPRGSATILTKPGALRLMIGEVNAMTFGNFATPPVVGLAKLVEVSVLGIPVLRVLGSSIVEIAQTTPIPLVFSSTEIAAGTVKSARTSTMVSSLTGSLLNNLKLNVPLLGLGLSLNSLGPLLSTILMPITPTLDLLIDRLLQAVGVSVGEADVTVYGVRCSHPVLVG